MTAASCRRRSSTLLRFLAVVSSSLSVVGSRPASIKIGDDEIRKVSYIVNRSVCVCQSCNIGAFGQRRQVKERGRRLVAYAAHEEVSRLLGRRPFEGPDAGELYQFGVASGLTMREHRAAFPHAKLWGFDSFRGLPAEHGGLFRKDNWVPGRFAHSVDTIPAFVEALGPPGFGEVEFVAGYYSDSLTKELVAKRRIRPAELVDVDVDLYSSTLQLMDWLFQNKLARVGTVFYYDDWTGGWCATSCKEKGARLSLAEIGEARAHIEIAAKHGVSFHCIAGICKKPSEAICDVHNADFAVFVVTGLNVIGGRHGIEISNEELDWWARRNSICQIGFRRRMLEPAADPGRCWEPSDDNPNGIFSHCYCCPWWKTEGDPQCWTGNLSYERCCRQP
eukprot:TRINITY_DN36105_c0_g1_i1.p1 TRINITY_DN36105_c0_g1~~TRINITY_DN36105_c0_g1_i1.p1  ORF type:complete len:391 (+),score=9.16 TRINITY_DN36105_c0_g1_i1:161-1333(+)